MRGKREKPAYHRKELKRALLGAVREEVREYGAADASLRRIARRAGVSHAAPYRHFKGKDGLLAALCWEGQAEFTAGLQQARDNGPPAALERICRLGDAYLDFAQKNQDVFQLMFSETGMRVMGVHLPEDMQAGLERYDSFSVLENVVKECQAAGILDKKEASAPLAYFFWSFVHGLAFIRKAGFLSLAKEYLGKGGEAMAQKVMDVFRRLLERSKR